MTDETLTFESALKELEQIVQKLESGDIALDESITLYERGTQLKQFCDTQLKEAKLKVEKITAVHADGSTDAVPFEAE